MAKPLSLEVPERSGGLEGRRRAAEAVFGRASFEARKGAHLRMTGLLL